MTDEQRERAISLYYDDGHTLGEIATEMVLPRGVYDLSPWIFGTDLRERMRQEGRWKPSREDLEFHLRACLDWTPEAVEEELQRYAEVTR